MSIGNISIIVGIFISIVTIINTFSKLEKNTKLVECYFKKVLRVYVKEYKKNGGIDPVTFIKDRFDIRDYFIPSYIFYLVDKSDREKLHKVLMTDYRIKFPSKKNLIGDGMFNIILIFLMILINVIFLESIGDFLRGVFTSFSSFFELDFLINANSDKDKIFSIFYYVLIGSIELTYVVIANKFIVDDYILTIKQIEKKINKKVKVFDNKSRIYRFIYENYDYYIN